MFDWCFLSFTLFIFCWWRGREYKRRVRACGIVMDTVYHTLWNGALVEHSGILHQDAIEVSSGFDLFGSISNLSLRAAKRSEESHTQAGIKLAETDPLDSSCIRDPCDCPEFQAAIWDENGPSLVSDLTGRETCANAITLIKLLYGLERRYHTDGSGTQTRHVSNRKSTQYRHVPCTLYLVLQNGRAH